MIRHKSIRINISTKENSFSVYKLHGLVALIASHKTKTDVTGILVRVLNHPKGKYQ